MKKTLGALAAVVALTLTDAASAQQTQQSVQSAQATQSAATAPALQAAPPVPRTFFEGVQLTFEGKAAIPGAVGIDVQTSGSEPKVVWVRILPKTTEGQIAEEVAKELTFALGPNYKIKTSGGRIRVTKDNKKATPISFWVAGLSIYGVSVKIEEY